MNTNEKTTDNDDTQTLAAKAEEAAILLEMQGEIEGAELAKW